jgi:hypothetical protein
MNWYLYKNQIFYSKQHAIQQIGYTILVEHKLKNNMEFNKMDMQYYQILE